MAVATKKYLEACKVYPDLKGKKPLEVYSVMSSKGFDWDTSEGSWVNETEKGIIPLINMNLKVASPLADDALELILNALVEYGLEIENTPRVYPSKTKDKKGNLVESDTESSIYIKVRFPDISSESVEEFTEE